MKNKLNNNNNNSYSNRNNNKNNNHNYSFKSHQVRIYQKETLIRLLSCKIKFKSLTKKRIGGNSKRILILLLNCIIII